MSKTIRNKILTLVVLGLVAAFAPAGGTADDGQDPALVPATGHFDARGALQLIYGGRSDSALVLVNHESEQNPYDPLVLLIKARAMRDQLADEDIDKSFVGEDNKPIHAVLDRTIELCDEAIKRKASDPIYHYYKGRAHLAKAQLHTLARELWSAGGASRTAKKHLEKYLELRPHDPDAQGDLGAFLYFADTLPGVVKFFGKLLMLPSGDRDRGLRMLDYASKSEGLFQTDHRITIAAVNLLFEGRLRDGTDQMLRLIEQYPYYTRLMEPLGVLAPLDPLRIDELLIAHDSAVDRHVNSGLVRFDDSLVKRMQVHSYYGRLFFGSAVETMPAVDQLVDAIPDRPDWAEPMMRLNRGVFLAMDGRTAEAQSDYDAILADDKFKHFHEIAGKLSEVNQDDTGRRSLADISWIDEIYSGHASKGREGLSAYESRYGRDPLYFFYAAELALVGQNFETARRSYEACMGVSTDGVDQYYQFWSCLRLAEIHGHQFRYSEARDFYDKARGYNRVTYLLDFLMKARVRYYTLLEDGHIDGPPRLLFYHTYESGEAYDGSRSDARN